MEQKDKIYREKQLIEKWDELKDHKTQIRSLLTEKKKFTVLDALVIFQCLAIVSEYIEIYEEEIKNSKNVISIDYSGIEKADISHTLEFQASLKNVSTMKDENSSNEERLDAIEKIRNTLWRNALIRKDEIYKVITNYHNDLEADDLFIVFLCVSAVLLELDMKEEEIKLLDEIWGF